MTPSAREPYFDLWGLTDLDAALEQLPHAPFHVVRNERLSPEFIVCTVFRPIEDRLQCQLLRI